MIRHPLTAIFAFPFFTLPALVLTTRTSPDWPSGRLSGGDAAMWAAFAIIWSAFIVWTVVRTVRYRASRIRLLEAAGAQDIELVLLGQIDSKQLETGLSTDQIRPETWLAFDTRSGTAVVCWSARGDLTFEALANGAQVTKLEVTDRSFSPGSTPELAIGFADSTSVHLPIRGPYSGIFPPSVASVSKAVDDAWRQLQQKQTTVD
ncbi:hypothetical protein [Microcella sp.]|uniref:hypothetical protein n=1 Tax=Microcella sp. TaxID=1913979 RepID=UPI00391891A6